MGVVTYRQALHDTLAEEMRRDSSVVLLGEEIGTFEGSYKITAGLLKEFGAWHGSELLPVFQHMAIAGYRPDAGDQAVTDAFLQYWTRFAATGAEFRSSWRLPRSGWRMDMFSADSCGTSAIARRRRKKSSASRVSTPC